MRIIFIRHCEPDYENDTLTEKGWREANLLSNRVSKWPVTDFYCSPQGRAQDTASLSLKKMNRTATTHDWMREFAYCITDPTTGREGVPWDFMPSYWTNEPLFYDKDRWFDAPIYTTNPDIKIKYKELCTELDKLLSGYGYKRDKNIYLTPPAPHEHQDATIVIFCHLGATFAMMSHLLGIAPTLLWQNCFVAPSSVTILATEERLPGEAYFRSQVIGDTTHLHDGEEPIAQAGYFAEPFQL